LSCNLEECSRRNKTGNWNIFEMHEEGKEKEELLLFGGCYSAKDWKFETKRKIYEYRIAGEERVDLHVEFKEKGVSFVQSVMNSVNVLVGIGILSFPFAFKNAGWIGGTGILMFTLISTCYTSRIIGKCFKLYGDLDLQSFSDLGRKAFGKRMEWFIGFVFFVELFLACAAYIILCGDNLHKLFPETLGRRYWMILVAAVVMPSTWLRNLAVLSFFSAFGILASVFLLFAVIYSGITNNSAPGSLIQPANTSLVEWNSLPIAFGLIMVNVLVHMDMALNFSLKSGFSGHAVLPNIYLSMDQKSRYNSMINLTYVIAFMLYAAISVIGYLMYGENTLQEISLNLEPGIVSSIATAMTIINPISKFALTITPSKISSFIIYAFLTDWLVCLNTEKALENRFHFGGRQNVKTLIGIIVRSLMTGLTLLAALYVKAF
jgi:amino acid permease